MLLFRFIMLGCFMLTAALARLDTLERDGPEGLLAMYGLAMLFLLSAAFAPQLKALWPLPAVWLFCLPVLFLLCWLLAIAAIILYGLSHRARGDEAFIIVPGTKVTGGKPSRLLRGRLDAALEYMTAAPETRCIVSGGISNNEAFAEADVMAAYLESKGILPARITRENKSLSTWGNFEQSLPLLRELGYTQGDTIAVCTDLFHFARCCWLAHKLGYGRLRLVPSVNGSLHCAGWFFREIMVFVRLWMKGPDYGSGN